MGDDEYPGLAWPGEALGPGGRPSGDGDPDVGVHAGVQPVGLEQFGDGDLDLAAPHRRLDAHDPAPLEEALDVPVEPERAAGVGAQRLEHGVPVEDRAITHRDQGIRRGHDLAVQECELFKHRRPPD